MEKQYYSRNRQRVFIPLIGISLLVLTSIWMMNSSSRLSRKNAWTCFRLNTTACFISKECLDFNVSYSINGRVIFHGKKNTAYLGKKIFQLSIDRMMAIGKFIDEYPFPSNLEGHNLLVEMEDSFHRTKIYPWTNESMGYEKLTSLLMIDKLVAFKRWSILWQMAHLLAMIRSREQTFKRSIESPSLIIPTTSNVYLMNVDSVMPYRYPRSTDRLLPTDGVLTRNFDENLCFSFQEEPSDFDLVDACLATNEIIGENQFYPLRDEFMWNFNTNERTKSTGKWKISFEDWISIHRGHVRL